MNYFMSDIHGASRAYFDMKDRIGLRANDTLYIVGDILDGNSKSPEECLLILDDIMNSDNVELILGDHEYAHIMYQASKDNYETNQMWEEHICHPLFRGEHLLKHMEENLSERERRRYTSFLISCEMTELLKIGKRYFYLVHGSPMVCRNEDVCSWQKNVAISPMDIEKNYFMAISQDPDLVVNKEITNNNLFTISGHANTKNYFEDYKSLMCNCYGNANIPTDDEPKSQKIILTNRKFLIDCGCSGDGIGFIENGWMNDLSCLAVDAAGFYVEYLLDKERIKNESNGN